MMFYLMSSVALGAGLLAMQSAKYSIGCLGLMLAVFPTGNAYSEMISSTGLYFFDFYTLGALIALCVRQLVLTNPQFRVSANLLVGSALFVALLAVGSTDIPDKYLLKDIRPLIMMLSFLVIANVTSLAAKRLRLNTLLKLLIAMTILNVLDIAWLRWGLYRYQDVYYAENAYRYLDAGTYAAVAYLIYYFITPRLFAEEKRLAAVCMVTSFVCLFIANSRFILLSVFIAIIIHQYSKPYRMMGIALLGAVTMFAFIAVSDLIGAERINDALSSKELVVQLVIRFSPAFTLISDMNFVHYLVGLGAGTYFDIPWFAYRGLDERNANIDSAYLTYFVKYGLLGLYLLFVFIVSVTHHLNNRVAVSISTFLGLMFIVSATPYQPYAIGLAYAAILLRAFSVSSAQPPSQTISRCRPLRDGGTRHE